MTEASYHCCCTGTVHCRYCKKAGKPPGVPAFDFEAHEEQLQKTRKEKETMTTPQPTIYVVIKNDIVRYVSSTDKNIKAVVVYLDEDGFDDTVEANLAIADTLVRIW